MRKCYSTKSSNSKTPNLTSTRICSFSLLKHICLQGAGWWGHVSVFICTHDPHTLPASQEKDDRTPSSSPQNTCRLVGRPPPTPSRVQRGPQFHDHNGKCTAAPEPEIRLPGELSPSLGRLYQRKLSREIALQLEPVADFPFSLELFKNRDITIQKRWWKHLN